MSSSVSHAVVLFHQSPVLKAYLLPPDLCLLFLTEKIWDNLENRGIAAAVDFEMTSTAPAVSREGIIQVDHIQLEVKADCYDKRCWTASLQAEHTHASTEWSLTLAVS